MVVMNSVDFDLIDSLVAKLSTSRYARRENNVLIVVDGAGIHTAFSFWSSSKMQISETQWHILRTR